MLTNKDELKRMAAGAALDEVRSGMRLGLGTGSTAEHFLRGLAERIDEGSIAAIRCVATSNTIASLAASLEVPCLDFHQLPELDLSVDGADEIDPSLRLIKGHGGALLKEKIIAQASKRYIVIADDSKKVTRLGKCLLPVEVATFAAQPLRERFRAMGIDPSPRMAGREWFVTDEGHRIFDVTVPPDRDIADLVDQLRLIAGVVETGFFPNEADEAFIAGPGGIERLRR